MGILFYDGVVLDNLQSLLVIMEAIALLDAESAEILAGILELL
jgi:hypothetical protein